MGDVVNGYLGAGEEIVKDELLGTDKMLYLRCNTCACYQAERNKPVRKLSSHREIVLEGCYSNAEQIN
jgi:hypothetical protein